MRRLDVVHHEDGIADANLPREFAEDVARGRFGGLEVAVFFAEIICAVYEAMLDGGFGFADGDVVPVALVFAEVAKTFVGIEEQIFVPVVAFAFDENAAALEADHFVVGAAQFAAGAERDHWLEFAGGGFELLEDGEIGIFRVENRVATVADDGDRLLKRAQSNCGAALRAI